MRKTSEQIKPFLSDGLLSNCKKEISKFGFTIREYEKFLESVQAMRGSAVLKYSNEEIDKYRNLFIPGKDNSLNDPLMFDTITKIRSSNENGNSYETGYFCPKSFWDLILKS